MRKKTIILFAALVITILTVCLIPAVSCLQDNGSASIHVYIVSPISNDKATITISGMNFTGIWNTYSCGAGSLWAGYYTVLVSAESEFGYKLDYWVIDGERIDSKTTTQQFYLLPDVAKSITVFYNTPSIQPTILPSGYPGDYDYYDYLVRQNQDKLIILFAVGLAFAVYFINRKYGDKR